MKEKVNTFKKIFTLMILMIFVSSTLLPIQKTMAASKYIPVNDFLIQLAKELSLPSVSGNTGDDYLDALTEKEILRTGDFASYEENLTRADAMLLLNRADEYLYGNTSDDKLVQTVIEKRISDIESIPEAKREDVAKAYIKGFMKGYSNGSYCTSRNLKLANKITSDGALSCIKLLTDKKNRAQISPDGQLIRTTRLPISYKKWPYILASYPNSYYDWMLYYEEGTDYYIQNGKKYPYRNLIDYAAPVDIDSVKGKDNYYSRFVDIRKEHLQEWVDKVQTYMELVFSANYKTIDDAWVDNVMKTDYAHGTYIESSSRKKLEQYVINMRENKTIVEYSQIHIDGSSLYFFNDGFYLRAYVKYRIVSSNIKYGVDTDTLIIEEPYNKILWAKNCLVNFTGFTLGKWRECGFDIRLDAYSSHDEYGINTALLDEYECKQYPVTKYPKIVNVR